jgi:tetratricopeptide (TPR) repeat protein
VKSFFPDGQLYVNFRNTASQDSLPPRALTQMLRSLGIADKDIPADSVTAEKMYRTVVSNKRVLILLDNAVNEADVRSLIPAGQGCAVLVTSQAKLALEGAISITLGLMSLQEASTLVGGLAGYDRVNDDPDSMSMLAQQCDFLPMALRIAGVKLASRGTWKIADLVRRWSDERRRLDELRVGDLAVRSSLQGSYERLESVAATIFRRLALLEATDYTVDVAAILSDISREEAGRYIEQLVDAQLLELSGHDRFRFQNLVRIFARGVNADEFTNTSAAAVLRVLQYYRAVVENAHLLMSPTSMGPTYNNPDLPFSSWKDGMAWLEIEQANLVAAVRQAAHYPISTNGDYATVLIATEMAQHLFDFFRLRRRWTDWQVVGNSALEAALRVGDRTSEGRARIKLGIGYYEQGQLDEALRHCEQSSAIAKETADPFLEGASLNEFGLIHRDQGRYDEATDCFRRAISISRELRNPYVEGKTLTNLGLLHALQGNRRQAIRFFKQDLTICRTLHDVQGEAETLFGLGNVYRHQGHMDRALSTLQTSSALFRQVNDHHGEGWTLYALGLLMEATGDVEAQQDYWVRAANRVDNFLDPEADKLRALVGKGSSR